MVVESDRRGGGLISGHFHPDLAPRADFHGPLSVTQFAFRNIHNFQVGKNWVESDLAWATPKSTSTPFLAPYGVHENGVK